MKIIKNMCVATLIVQSSAMAFSVPSWSGIKSSVGHTLSTVGKKIVSPALSQKDVAATQEGLSYIQNERPQLLQERQQLIAAVGILAAIIIVQNVYLYRHQIKKIFTNKKEA